MKEIEYADVSRSLGIDAEYYIRNLLIPPLSRIFNLVGADVEHWYDSMPRTKRAGKYEVGGANKTRIDSHFRSSHCVVCGIESSNSELQSSHSIQTAFSDDGCPFLRQKRHL